MSPQSLTSSWLREVFAPREDWGDEILDERPDSSHEHFIPIRKSDLLQALMCDADMRDEDRQALQRYCGLLEATIHYQFNRRLERLKDLYAPFDPDSATVPIVADNDVDRERQIPVLFDRVTELLRRANYRKLEQHEIETATDAASEWGLRLRVDFQAFERLEVYACGDVLAKRERRRWWNAYRKEEVLLPLFQRLVVIVRLRQHKWHDKQADINAVYLKMFKNIPKQDVDMLLPGTRFQMSLLDRGKILLPTASGVVIAAVKIVKGAVVLAFSGVYGLLALVTGTIGYGVKSFLGYQHTRDRYHLNLTRSLYFQNLDNNAGVMFRVLNEAEEQEFREAVLGYFLLWRRAGYEGWTAEELDRAAEACLARMLGFHVDFEVRDALQKLVRWGAVEPAGGGRWRAVPPERAFAQLDHAWDDYFQAESP